MAAKREEKKEKEGQKKKTILIICICALLVVAAGAASAAVVLLMGNKEEETGGYTMNQDNYQQIAEEMDAKVEAGYFETYMNTEWTFADGTSETKDAILGNSPNNTKPIRCEVLLDETGEKVCSTGVLPVGAQVPAFKLDIDLEAGTYDATCMIYLMEEAGDGTWQDASNAGFHVTIKVEN